LAAAVRQANTGNLDLAGLARIARAVAPNLHVLTGIARADRWPELRPSGLVTVLTLARAMAPLIVVDCGFSLEQDEELSYDTAAPRRNGSTLAVLSTADVVLAVGSADPVGLQRLVRGLAELREAVPDCQPRVVVNRVRKGSVPGDAAAQISAALLRHAGVEQALLVPYDRSSLDEAIAGGRALAEVAPDSPVRKALLPLAVEFADHGATARRRRRRKFGEKKVAV
jgi:Flp pilus assembly CpaE family ATPase